MIAVYLSGPISNTPDYRGRFAAAQEVLERLARILEIELEVINPAAGPFDESDPWAEAVLYDLGCIRGVQLVIFLPGWKGSPGARVEREFASGLGLPLAEFTELDLVSPGRALKLALLAAAENCS